MRNVVRLSAETGRPTAESLTAARDDARRERLLDMELRLRPYRFACFAILAIGLAAFSSELGWWWTIPLTAGLAGLFGGHRISCQHTPPELLGASRARDPRPPLSQHGHPPPGVANPDPRLAILSTGLAHPR